jgi:hypothetical protein
MEEELSNQKVGGIVSGDVGGYYLGTISRGNCEF